MVVLSSSITLLAVQQRGDLLIFLIIWTYGALIKYCHMVHKSCKLKLNRLVIFIYQLDPIAAVLQYGDR